MGLSGGTRIPLAGSAPVRVGTVITGGAAATKRSYRARRHVREHLPPPPPPPPPPAAMADAEQGLPQPCLLALPDFLLHSILDCLTNAGDLAAAAAACSALRALAAAADRPNVMRLALPTWSPALPGSLRWTAAHCPQVCRDALRSGLWCWFWQERSLLNCGAPVCCVPSAALRLPDVHTRTPSLHAAATGASACRLCPPPTQQGLLPTPLPPASLPTAAAGARPVGCDRLPRRRPTAPGPAHQPDIPQPGRPVARHGVRAGSRGGSGTLARAGSAWHGRHGTAGTAAQRMNTCGFLCPAHPPPPSPYLPCILPAGIQYRQQRRRRRRRRRRRQPGWVAAWRRRQDGSPAGRAGCRAGCQPGRGGAGPGGDGGACGHPAGPGAARADGPRAARGAPGVWPAAPAPGGLPAGGRSGAGGGAGPGAGGVPGAGVPGCDRWAPPRSVPLCCSSCCLRQADMHRCSQMHLALWARCKHWGPPPSAPTCLPKTCVRDGAWELCGCANVSIHAVEQPLAAARHACAIAGGRSKCRALLTLCPLQAATGSTRNLCLTRARQHGRRWSRCCRSAVSGTNRPYTCLRTQSSNC